MQGIQTRHKSQFSETVNVFPLKYGRVTKPHIRKCGSPNFFQIYFLKEELVTFSELWCLQQQPYPSKNQ